MPNITDQEVTRLVESMEIVQRELTNAVRALNEDQRGSAQDALGAATRQVVTLKAILQNYQLRGDRRARNGARSSRTRPQCVWCS
jgi:hypothetical protein